jgi:predicted component of viral defense system (DUF524 family)
VDILPAGRVNVPNSADHPLVRLPTEEARMYAEEPVQLCERGRYEYRLKPSVTAPVNLALLPQRGIHPSRVETDGDDRGLIEPGDHCGLLPLVVIQRNDAEQRPLAWGAVEVRPIKLGYREHYRGMLSFIAEKCTGLLLDCRAPTRLRFDTLWREDARILEQQLEFLRHTIQSPSFRGAVDEVLRNPHRRLEEERESRDIYRPFKAGKDFARQVSVAAQRVPVPQSHPLRARLASLPARIQVQTRADFLDTAENRFVKMALTEFRDFLADVAAHLNRNVGEEEKPENQRLLREAARLRGTLESQLARGFLPDLSPPSILPLGSPVLQRKGGYREMFRFWLQFHAGAQLVWDGGFEVFEAGSRNVATLYEYWLFFQIEMLFRQMFACEQPLHALLVNTKKTPPQLVLKRGVELTTPVSGVWSQTAGRHLRAEFHFNRKFAPKTSREAAGSWTRGVQPDYTISIWPAEFTKQEAEDKELMVHVHFDAKYRVERVREILGDEEDDTAFKADADAKESQRSAARYADLLKMHAYRDAIRRTAGAYVLYPGRPGDEQKFQGFHEVLAGLGAFAIRPDKEGKAEGLGALRNFLGQVVEHLANRTTVRERVTYHVAEAYEVEEDAVAYGKLHLPESDIYGKDYRALPPAEHMILVAWYETAAQLEIARFQNGFVYVRLGRRAGALHVHPNLAKVRHVLLRTHQSQVACGLLVLREPGFRVFTRKQLRAELAARTHRAGVAAWESSVRQDDEEFIYALFSTQPDASWEGCDWNGDKVMELIEAFETDSRNKLAENVGRQSPYPRILPLRDLLMAQR